MRNLLLAAACLVVLAGCADRPPFTDAPAPPPGEALVYIYRDYNNQQRGQASAIYLDSKLVVNLANGAYTWLHVPAGEHVLEQRKSGDMGGERIAGPIRLTEGRTHYFRTGVSLATGIQEVHWDLSEEPVFKARDALARCQYQAVRRTGQ